MAGIIQANFRNKIRKQNFDFRNFIEYYNSIRKQQWLVRQLADFVSLFAGLISHNSASCR